MANARVLVKMHACIVNVTLAAGPLFRPTRVVALLLTLLHPPLPLSPPRYNFNDSHVRKEPSCPAGSSSSAYVLFYRMAHLPPSSL